MAIEQYEEVSRVRKYAQCRECKHQGKLSAFRLVTPKEVVQQGGVIKIEKIFDGKYRCPFCGAESPRQWSEEVVEVVRKRA